VFGVASDCHDDGLLDLAIVEVLSYFFGCSVSVHYWHITIHKYEVIITIKSRILSNILLDLLQCFLPIHALITHQIYINVEHKV
jgi:hypothetical protein